MIRNAPVHVATWLLIVVSTCLVYSQEKPGKCNVKLWYLDLVTEGALSGELTDGQLVLKAKIEKMVDKYKKLGRADGMVDCSILQMYEELLGEEPTDGQDTDESNDGKSNDDEANEQNESSDVNGRDEVYDDVGREHVESDNDKNDKQKESDNVNNGDEDASNDVKYDDQNESDDKTHGEDSNGIEQDTNEGTDNQDGNGDKDVSDNSVEDLVDDTDLDDTDFGGDDEEEDDVDGSEAVKAVTDTHAEESLEINDADEDFESSDDKYTETSDDKDTESSDDKDSETSDDKDSETSDNKDSDTSDDEDSDSLVDKDLESSHDKDLKSSNGKESLADKDLSDNKDKQSSEPADDKDSKTSVKEDDASNKSKKLDSEDAKVRKRKTRLVEQTVFDTRRGYVKVVKEVEVDDDGEEEEEDNNKELTDEKLEEGKQKKKKEKEEEEKKQKEKEEEQTRLKEEKERKEKEEEQREKENEEEEKRLERKEQEEEETLKKKEIERAKEEEDEKGRVKKEEGGEKKSVKPWEKTKSKERKPWDKAKSKEETSDESCSGDDCEGQCHGDSSKCKERNPDKVEKDDNADKYKAQANHFSDHEKSEDEESAFRKSQKQNNEAENTDKEVRRAENFHDFTTDLHRFELLFQQRASEYASKIQNLEIMIIRLENQLLGERLNKQNSTSTFSKLENQILRLENELLKLNQSYAILKEENVLLNHRQRKYLELGHDNRKDQSSMGNNTKHFELINKQQNKISELSALLMNHSALFDKLQSKSHVLEEQNHALYQIVMNQTALISNIMKKMQELSEENMKHRKETQDLKTQMEIKTNSDRLLEKLNTLVSVQIPSADDTGEKQEVQKAADEVFNMHKFFPKSPDADVRPWRCNGNRSSRFCVFYSFILSPCPPFSTVYWHKCPYYFKDMSLEVDKHHASSQMSEPLTSQIEGSPVEDNAFAQVPSASSADTSISPADSASKDALPAMSSEEGKVLEDILKPDKEAQQTKEKTETSDDKSEKDEDKSETLESKSEKSVRDKSTEKEAEANKHSEDSGRLPHVEKVKVAPAKPAEPRHEDRKILYTTDKQLPKPRDCYEYMQNGYLRNGMHKIYLVGLEKHLPVYCDMKNGGWTVIMKRASGGLDFYKDWNEYKKGFGGFYSEHWLGNDNLHFLTNQKHYSLKVILEDFGSNTTFAEYDHFWIDEEDEGYRLHISGYSGTAGDGFAKHNKMKFSTKDVDNDLITKELKEYDNSCAKRFHGAWWYYKCYMSNLTGQYYKTGDVPDKSFNGVSWKPWKKPHISLKGAIMMIRPFKAE